MNVLLYDTNVERSRRIQFHLEDDDIWVKAVYTLREFLTWFQKPQVKIYMIEEACIKHYNLDVDAILAEYALIPPVIVYREEGAFFSFKQHISRVYRALNFQTGNKRKTLKQVKASIEKLKQPVDAKQPDPILSANNLPNHESIKEKIDEFSNIERKIITLLLEYPEGCKITEIANALDANDKKNLQNYVQSNIRRLRIRLQLIFRDKYIIMCQNHKYQLLSISNDKPSGK